ncbi:hypothetical protein [Allorhodopirellula heiligendammensis]|uniref:Uncharacterized protein n=1 Tax=Allorhodopirellula heiligendammensis TaxID=2714739 RepID=A0A5C6C503_9BACT|nr:hypothetical protein [Allorhodopirellula heiligendammensis]TWU19175.1 hypothetical protein Poly21_13460 [Allorhodopirellula heiligendammensis]
MPLRITCPQGHLLNVKEELLGKTIRCPSCKTLLTVGKDSASSSTLPESATQTPQQSLAPPADSSDSGPTPESTIIVKCPAGHQLKVRSKLTGKRARCPKCQQTFTISKRPPPQGPPKPKASPVQKAPSQSAINITAQQPTVGMNPADHEGGAEHVNDAPAFDDASGFGDIPDFENGQTFDQLPEFDVDPLAAPANTFPSMAIGTSSAERVPAFPLQGLSPPRTSSDVKSVESKQATSDHAPSQRIPWRALAAGVALGLALLGIEGYVFFGTGSRATAAKPMVNAADSSAATDSLGQVAASATQAARQVQPSSPPLDPAQNLQQEQEMLSNRKQKSKSGQETQEREQGSLQAHPILAEIKPDENSFRLEGSPENHVLPTKTWSIAYDEPSGRIALTLDRADGKSGVVAVYDIDNLLSGPADPIAIFATPGLPTAVTIKPWKDTRLYAVACNQSANVWLYDVETLQSIGELSTGDPQSINIQDIGSSRDSNDPFLYFAAIQSFERHGTTYKNNVVGRFDLSTMKLDSKTEPLPSGRTADEPDSRLEVSADGSTLFGINSSYRYEKLPGDGTLGRLTHIHEIDRYDGSRLASGPLGIQTLASHNLCSRDLFVTDNTGVRLLDSGKENAILLGVEKSNAKQAIDPDGWIKIISANNYKVHATKGFKDGIAKRSVSNESRAHYHPNLWGFLDETRGLAIMATNSSIFVWSDLLDGVPQEPWLTVTSDIPAAVSIGEEISIPLKTPSEADVTYELIDQSPYFVEEKNETDSHIQVSYRDSLTFGPFPTYSIPSDITLRNDFEIIVLLQTPDGKWTRQYTTSELTFRDFNDDGKIDRTDDENNPDRKMVAIETVTANNDMSLTFEPLSDAIRPSLEPRTDGLGRVYQYARTRPVRAAVCIVQGDDPKEVIAITKVATLNILVTDTIAVMRGGLNTAPRAAVPKPKPPLQNRLPRDDFREQAKFVSTQDSSIAIVGDSLTWTPSAKQIGKLSLGIRARSGELVKDTYFGVNVKLGGSHDPAALPFYVNGISFQRDSDLAVIWGNDSDMEVSWQHQRKMSAPPPGIKYMVGVYDWRRGEVLRHDEAPGEIEFAAISPSGICATLPNPPRLIRFDHRTLKPIKQVPLQGQATRVVVVADKYVAASSSTTGERFELPSLKPIQPGVPTTSTLLAEEFGDGWMWEGVHWDKAMREPRLLALPIAFGVGPDRNVLGHVKGFEKAARLEPSGPVLLTLHDSRANVTGHQLPMYPCRLHVQREGAEVVGEVAFDHENKIRKILRPALQAPDPEVRGGGPLAVSHGPEFSATIIDGRVRFIPYSLWELPEIGFNFQPVQSTFLLNAARPTEVQYAAPDAVKYRLRLMSGYTTKRGDFSTEDNNAKVLFEGESTDGSFQIAFESIQALVEAAQKIAGINDQSYRSHTLSPEQLKKLNSDALAAYRSQVTDAYRSLAGRAPRNIPVPVYAYVTAENATGEKAALFHAYLVDVDVHQ